MIIDDFSNPKRKLTVSEASAANDYFTRRKSEEERIAGVKAPAKNKKNPANTDYAKKRKQQDVTEAGHDHRRRAAASHDDEECSSCDGTGEGRHEGQSCGACGGSGVARGQYDHDDFDIPDKDDMYEGVAEGSLNEGQYEMMMRNGQVKKFIAKDDTDAKRIAAGHGAKSVIRMKGNVPGDKIGEQGVAEGAPELLKKEMPLHRHAEKLLAQNGVSKNDPDYHHHLGNTIKHLRQFGNIDLINKQGVAEAFPNPGSGSTGSSKEDKRIAAALRKKHIPPTPNDKKEQGVAEGSEENIDQFISGNSPNFNGESNRVSADTAQYNFINFLKEKGFDVDYINDQAYPVLVAICQGKMCAWYDFKNAYGYVSEQGKVVFSGTGANGGKYEIIHHGDDFMIRANGKHIDSYGSLKRAMGVLKNEVPGLKQGVAEDTTDDLLNMRRDDPRIKQNQDITALAKEIYAQMVAERGQPMDRRQQQTWMRIAQTKAAVQLSNTAARNESQGVAESNTLMKKLHQALLKEGRVKELADDLKTLNDTKFMKKYGKAKAAIRKDMKKLHEAVSTLSPEQLAYNQLRAQLDSANFLRGGNTANTVVNTTPEVQASQANMNNKLAQMAAALKAKGIDAAAEYDAPEPGAAPAQPVDLNQKYNSKNKVQQPVAAAPVPPAQPGVAEARTSAAQRLSTAWDRQRAKSNASLARTPGSIPKKQEPKKADPVPKTVSEHRAKRQALMAQMLNGH